MYTTSYLLSRVLNIVFSLIGEKMTLKLILAERTNRKKATARRTVGHDILGGARVKILLYIPDVCTHLSYGPWRHRFELRVF